ncbi:MAG: aminoacyl-tRNA hydrolase [Deltaproteobacteria bacterium]|nr:MAG: aminoacyl-tRNA hydrolase [Deltaproteobacteria bacterium]
MNTRNKRLVVGLGNPGRKYRQTRHNTGFMVVDALAAMWRVAFSDRLTDIEFGRHSLVGIDVFIAKPLGYMNNSGPPVQQLVDRYHFKYEDLIIVYDDIDLAFGTLKIKEKGGSGGHNGIKSIMQTFGSGAFTRLRVGIGRPIPGVDVTGHVLRPFELSERDPLLRVIDRAAEAVHAILCEGTLSAMNRFNGKQM